MEKFRFPPARPRSLFIAALAFVTVVLALPAIVHAVLPQHHADVEQVTLSDPSHDWDITVSDLYCERDYASLASVGWTCGDVTVQAVIVEDTDDDEHTLRRMVRAYGMAPGLPEGEVHEGKDGALALADAPSSTAAISINGTGTDENKDWVVTVTGDSAATRTTTERLWKAFGQDELPEEVTADIEEFSGKALV
ncbi:hypothetical protein [Corynebacterium accolens]|uniref:hypothetical protein n=1 Tax=Corynebacterium accolens TaxID=38284 RepID=UPI0002F69ECE|nr:hypothetical protein [Corynebacterium accolens]UQZ26857.1 hypothetical protein CACC_00570 [Corynebacterium accolens]